MANANIVQIVSNSLSANGTSITLTYSQTQQGNTLVALLGYGGNGTITLPPGWVKVVEIQNGTTEQLGLYWMQNVSAGQTAFVFSFASAGCAIVGYELTPVDFYVLQDKSASSSGNSVNAATGTTAATTFANEIVIGGCGYSGGTNRTLTSILNGFTLDLSLHATGGTNIPHVYALSKTVSATGAQNSGGTLSASATWMGVICTFKLATPAWMFVVPSPQVLQFAKEGATSSQLSGAVNVTMALSTSNEAGGQFIGPSAYVLAIAETGQSQRIGAVNVTMALSATDEAGGMFIGPAARVQQFAIEATRVVLPGAVNVSAGLSVADEAGGMFLAPAAQMQQFAIEAARVVLAGQVNVGMALATSETPGGMFVGPSAGVLSIAELGQPVAGGVMNGAVNVGLGLSLRNEPGGMFVGPSAGVLSIAETGQSQRIGAVNVSMGLSASEEAGGMFVAPAVQMRAFAIEAARTILAGQVNVNVAMSTVEAAGGMFIGPAAGIMATAQRAIFVLPPPLGTLTPVGTAAAGRAPGGAIGAGTVPGGAVSPGASPSGILSTGTTPGGTITGPNEPGGSIGEH